MRPTFRFKATDKGWKELQKTMKALKDGDLTVKAGVLGSGTRSDGTSNVDIAIIHEFGAPEANIPERSFIRSTFNAHRAGYRAILKQHLPRIYKLQVGARRVLELIGQKMAADMKATIRAGIAPPLKPATIARKGSSKPLVDTGQLITSITYAVTKKGDAP